MPQLRRLTLSFNKLTGFIPKCLASNKLLQVFCVDNNKLSGTVPTELQAHEPPILATFHDNAGLKKPYVRKNAKLQCLKFTDARVLDTLAIYSQCYHASKRRHQRAMVRVYDRVYLIESNGCVVIVSIDFPFLHIYS